MSDSSAPHFEGFSGGEERRDNISNFNISQSETITDRPNQKLRKKFTHSTRRKKQRVKELLNSDEKIDLLKLPVVDLLWLEEHKQKSSEKDRKSRKNNANKNGEEPSGEGETTYGSGSSETLFNSHSFMEKERAVRWSKQDTELFYEGVRQFGSNMSMIQQLFPGRTRDQIKKKFKKEENLRPLRLSDAVSGGTKDHTYFTKVIEHLKKDSATSQTNIKNDDAPDEGKTDTMEDKNVAGDGEAEIDGELESFDVDGNGNDNGDDNFDGTLDGDGGKEESFEYTYCTDF